MDLRDKLPIRRMTMDPANGKEDAHVEPTWWEMLHAQQRTCTRCGASTLFYPSDAMGDWFRCGRCGRFA
jgi:ribosomal protein S27AE